jgi:hypothetical protein
MSLEYRLCLHVDSPNIVSGHNITEIVFDGVKIAGAKSHDFFGDGSMFLLDAPGVSDYTLAISYLVS